MADDDFDLSALEALQAQFQSVNDIPNSPSASAATSAADDKSPAEAVAADPIPIDPVLAPASPPAAPDVSALELLQRQIQALNDTPNSPGAGNADTKEGASQPADTAEADCSAVTEPAPAAATGADEPAGFSTPTKRGRSLRRGDSSDTMADAGAHDIAITAQKTERANINSTSSSATISSAGPSHTTPTASATPISTVEKARLGGCGGVLSAAKRLGWSCSCNIYVMRNDGRGRMRVLVLGAHTLQEEGWLGTL